jgi:hypothetical protein
VASPPVAPPPSAPRVTASPPVAPPRADAPPRVAAPPPAARAPAPPRNLPIADGALRIDSDSPVAIEIDGRAYGRAPVVGVRLTRGEHRVLAHYPDGSVAMKTVFVGDDDVAIFFR